MIGLCDLGKMMSSFKEIYYDEWPSMMYDAKCLPHREGVLMICIIWKIFTGLYLWPRHIPYLQGFTHGLEVLKHVR
jgi:hypothetical protein